MSTNTPATTKPSPKREVRDLVESGAFKAQLAKVAPKHLTPDRIVRVFLNASMKTPKILQCTQESLTKCLLDCSAYGLEPDGRRAHLIPFEDKKNGVTICTLIIDYKGLIELAMRSGLVSYLHADVVREGDVFDYNMGQVTKHVPWFLRTDAEKPADAGQDIAVYAYARMKDGATAVAVMSIAEVEHIRDGSQGWRAFKAGYTKQCPWDPTNWVSEQEMKKKTAFRRLSKILPLSPEIRDAIAQEEEREEREINVTPKADASARFESVPELEPATEAAQETEGQSAEAAKGGAK